MKLRRVRLPCVSVMVDIVFPFRKMSTKPDQAQNRKIVVLGYNHNRQSSPGVSGKIAGAIRDWVQVEFAKTQV